MSRQLLTITVAIALLAGLPLASQAPAAETIDAPQEPLDELDTVLVVGEFPGPGLWKVSRGDHVLWVLASYAPLPKGMVWRSHKIEARIAESQAMISGGSVRIDAGIGLLRGLTLIPSALKASRIPDGKTLKDVLDPQTYDKWLQLRTRYLGKDDDVERLRPSLALQQLRSAAFRKSGLGGTDVHEVVDRALRKHKVRKIELPTVKRTLQVENPRGMLKSAQKIDLPDLECFMRGLDRVEPGIERARTLANAWSRGDVAKLRSMHRNVKLRDAVREGCTYVLMAALHDGPSADAANAKKMMENALWHAEQASVQSQNEWVAAARAALEKNRSTFTVLSLAEVFSPDGHLEKLRQLGYTVEAPE